MSCPPACGMVLPFATLPWTKGYPLHKRICSSGGSPSDNWTYLMLRHEMASWRHWLVEETLLWWRVILHGEFINSHCFVFMVCGLRGKILGCENLRELSRNGCTYYHTHRLTGINMFLILLTLASAGLEGFQRGKLISIEDTEKISLHSELFLASCF